MQPQNSFAHIRHFYVYSTKARVPRRVVEVGMTSNISDLGQYHVGENFCFRTRLQ